MLLLFRSAAKAPLALAKWEQATAASLWSWYPMRSPGKKLSSAGEADAVAAERSPPRHRRRREGNPAADGDAEAGEIGAAVGEGDEAQEEADASTAGDNDDYSQEETTGRGNCEWGLMARLTRRQVVVILCTNRSGVAT
ncbi:hypothetical protein ON010_g15210 [Phytophthora cinnamomi]|nr:hypothetical protein ON010_g15210 [Phytophthora cinnamomi]